MKPLLEYINETYGHIPTVDDRLQAAACAFWKSKRTMYKWVKNPNMYYLGGKIVEVKACEIR